MKTYSGANRFILFSSIGFIVVTVAQLLVNLHYQRFFFVVLFGLLAAGFGVFAVFLALDLIVKDQKTMSVRVVRLDREIITIRKPNGKKRKIRIMPSEIGKFGEGETLELILTKRTGRIVSVKGETP
ncbi:hypothetical protein [Cohnella sp.]|uniref:hypothetical protein n=1 Tax=Cohnella sp. TaxID=1883426 RepID=UPI003566B04F